MPKLNALLPSTMHAFGNYFNLRRADTQANTPWGWLFFPFIGFYDQTGTNFPKKDTMLLDFQVASEIAAEF